jgi:hypothetical protein
MSPNDIQAGKTYTNRGAGKTRRTVIAIGDDHCPAKRGGYPAPHQAGPGVMYEQDGVRRNLYLSSFAKWAGKEVE